MLSIPQKHCSKCKLFFPATTEYFYKHHQQPSGLSPRCKACVAQDHGVKNPYKIIKCEVGMRGCRQCGKVYPATAEYFRAQKDCKDGISHTCLECIRAKQRESKKKPEVRLKRNEWNRNYTKTEVGRKKNTDRCRDYLRNSPVAKKNKRIQEQKRIARKKQLPHEYTLQQWEYALEYFGYCCAVCNRPFTDTLKAHMDHWIPLSDPDCPGTVVTNIVPLCGGKSGCNLFKHDANPILWIRSKYSLAEADKIIAKVLKYFREVAHG